MTPVPAVRGLAIVAAIAVAASVVLATPADAATAAFLGPIGLASSTAATALDTGSTVTSVSGDGRYIAFSSDASDLVPGDDRHGYQDVFVRDAVAGTTTLVSVGVDGAPGNDYSSDAVISRDGRYVIFTSAASDLVLGDTNGEYDIFVRDLVAKTTTRVSVSGSGVQANDESYSPNLSASGRYVVFTSPATNLVPGDVNGYTDVFEHDLVTGSTTLVSLADNDSQGDRSSGEATVSADGRYVAFASAANSLTPGGPNYGVNNFIDNIYVRDTVAQTTTLVSRGIGNSLPNGDSVLPSISDNGQSVAFSSTSSNLVSGDTNSKRDIFVTAVATGAVTRVSEVNGVQGNGDSRAESITGDGRFVVFSSAADNFGPGHSTGNSDLWVRDLQSGTARQVNLTPAGAPSHGGVDVTGVLSADGRFVAFSAAASDLVPGVSPSYLSVYFRQIAGDGPAITQQPTSSSVVSGHAFTLTAAATGDPAVTLQWQSAAKGGAYTDIPGATSSTLTLTAGAVSTSGGSYRLVATNAIGNAISAPAVVTVTTNKAKATISAKTVKSRLHHSAKLRIVVKTSKTAGKVHLGTVTVKLGKKTVKSKVKLSKKGVATITVSKKFLKKAKTYRLSVIYNGSTTTTTAKKTAKIVVRR